MKPRALCACCGRPGAIEARNLRKACYERRRRDGTLRLYAPARRLPASSARIEALAGAEAEEREARVDYEALRKLTRRARARVVAAEARVRLLRAPGRERSAA